jgi:hypothetical protein
MQVSLFKQHVMLSTTITCYLTGTFTAHKRQKTLTIGIKLTESNQTYGQLSACQFSRRYSKIAMCRVLPKYLIRHPPLTQ